MITTEPTPEQFQANQSQLEEFRLLLYTNKALMAALRTVRGLAPERHRRTILDQNASAALHNQSVGYHAAIDNLLALAEPPTEENPEPDLPSEEELERRLYESEPPV